MIYSSLDSITHCENNPENLRNKIEKWRGSKLTTVNNANPPSHIASFQIQ